MFHHIRSFLELYPHDSLISHMCMTRSGGDSIERDFFTSHTISYCSDLFSEGASVESRFFLKLSQCCLFDGFPFFDTAFWEHDTTISMEDTEELSGSFPLADADATSTVREPPKRHAFLFPS